MIEFIHGKDADRERLKTALMRGGCYIIKLEKPYTETGFTSMNDAEIRDIDFPIVGTITARYFKGIGANGDNMVLEVTNEKD